MTTMKNNRFTFMRDIEYIHITILFLLTFFPSTNVEAQNEMLKSVYHIDSVYVEYFNTLINYAINRSCCSWSSSYRAEGDNTSDYFISGYFITNQDSIARLMHLIANTDTSDKRTIDCTRKMFFYSGGEIKFSICMGGHIMQSGNQYFVYNYELGHFIEDKIKSTYPKDYVFPRGYVVTMDSLDTSASAVSDSIEDGLTTVALRSIDILAPAPDTSDKFLRCAPLSICKCCVFERPVSSYRLMKVSISDKDGISAFMDELNELRRREYSSYCIDCERLKDTYLIAYKINLKYENNLVIEIYVSEDGNYVNIGGSYFGLSDKLNTLIRRTLNICNRARWKHVFGNTIDLDGR